MFVPKLRFIYVYLVNFDLTQPNLLCSFDKFVNSPSRYILSMLITNSNNQSLNNIQTNTQTYQTYTVYDRFMGEAGFHKIDLFNEQFWMSKRGGVRFWIFRLHDKAKRKKIRFRAVHKFKSPTLPPARPLIILDFSHTKKRQR